MQQIISEMSLTRNLNQARRMLENISISNSNSDNLIFINAEAFYSYIDKKISLSGKRHRDFSTVMANIEPYIPLTVTDKDLSTMMGAIAGNDLDELDKLESSLVIASRIRFVHCARSSPEDEWQRLCETCRKIREYKAQEAATCFV